MGKKVTIECSEEQAVWLLEAYESWAAKQIKDGICDLDDMTDVLVFRRTMISAMEEIKKEEPEVQKKEEAKEPEKKEAEEKEPEKKKPEEKVGGEQRETSGGEKTED